MAELKPCPFCGGEAEIEEQFIRLFDDDDDLVSVYEVRCKSCHVEWYNDALEDAYTTWNRRISTECSIGCGICLAHNNMKCPRMVRETE